jgi:energy-coupling factor transporter ATP-binding protein EcfA2
MSAYAGEYRWDVFVSYASVDNVPMGSSLGWVEEFVTALSYSLDALSGRRDQVRIFKDTTLRREERLSEALDRDVQSSAVFLALLSHGFKNSPFCQRELHLFTGAATRGTTGITSPGGLQRVLPVRLVGRSVVDGGPPLSEVIGHDFTEGDDANFPVTARSPEFYSKVQQLAVGIMSILDDLKNYPTASGRLSGWLTGTARQAVSRVLGMPVLRLNDEDRRVALVRRAFEVRAPGLCKFLERSSGSLDRWIDAVVEATVDYGIADTENAVTILLETIDDSNFLETGSLLEAKSAVTQCWTRFVNENYDTCRAQIRRSRRMFDETEIEFVGDLSQHRLTPAWEFRTGARWRRFIAARVMHAAAAGANREYLPLLRELVELRHRNIVPVHDFFRLDSWLMAECAWRPGDRLSTLTGPLDITAIRKYVLQLADALDFAHLKGVVHGRLSPECIFLDSAREFAVIIGFGYVIGPKDEEMTRVWEAAADYGILVAPEARHRPAIPASDQYSLAALVYGLLIGINEMGTSLDELKSRAGSLVPDSVAEVIDRALANEPGRRFGSTMEFADALSWALDTGMKQSAGRATEHAYLSMLRLDCIYGTTGYVRLTGQRFGSASQARGVGKALTGAGRVRVQHPVLFQVSPARSDDAPRVTEDVSQDLRGGGRVLLLGEPGSGKSTTLIHAALEACREAQLDRGAPIPVVIPLNLYEPHQSVEDFVKEQMPGLESEYERLLSDNRLLLLFDALNEMVPEGRSAVRTFVTGLRDFTVSCRTRDYEHDLDTLSGLTLIKILPLDITGIRLAFDKMLGAQAETLWITAAGCRELIDRQKKMRLQGEDYRYWDRNYIPGYTSEHEDAAWDRMRRHGILELCRNPFLLRVITEIFRANGEVPQERSAIFEMSIRTLITRELDRLAALERWDGYDDARRMQLEVAIRQAMVEIAGLIQERQNGSGIIRRLAIEGILTDLEESERERVLSLCEDANIVVRQGEHLMFNHQLVQEYFAGTVMLDHYKHDGDARRFFPIENWYRPQGWEETAIILAGILGQSGAPGFVRWLADAQPSVALRCIQEAGIPGLTVETMAEDLRSWLRDRWLSLWAAEEGRPAARVVVGKCLAHVGDTRRGVGVILRNDVRLPNINWIDIGKGIQVSKYPITVAQYQCVVEHEVDVSKRRQPSMGGCSTWPVTNVSWQEADEFCKWLSERLGRLVRLPFEEEWNLAAAGGGSASPYPWGAAWIEGNGNVASGAESDMRSLSPVGSYGGRDDRVEDLFGNVWEWCADSKGVVIKYPEYNNGIEEALHLLKGGSWRRGPEFASARYRFWAHEGYMSDDVGFRIVAIENTHRQLPGNCQGR